MQDASVAKREWLQVLERQAQEKADQKKKEKLERLIQRDVSVAIFDNSRTSSGTDVTLMEPIRNEFGAKRRPYQEIVKFEKEVLASTTPLPTKAQLYRQQRAAEEQEAIERQQNKTHNSYPDNTSQTSNHAKSVKKERVPFSGSFKTKSPSFHRTRSSFEDPAALELEKKEREAQEWKEYLKRQIQEKKDRIEKEKEHERQMELKEIARLQQQRYVEPEGPAKTQIKESSAETLKAPSPPSKSKRGKKSPRPSRLPQLKKEETLSVPPIEQILPSLSKIKSLLLSQGKTLGPLVPKSSSQKFGKSPSSILTKSSSQRFEKPVEKKVKRPVQIVQRYPVRKDNEEPPRHFIKEWPAGAKAVRLERHTVLPPIDMRQAQTLRAASPTDSQYDDEQEEREEQERLMKEKNQKHLQKSEMKVKETHHLPKQSNQGEHVQESRQPHPPSHQVPQQHVKTKSQEPPTTLSENAQLSAESIERRLAMQRLQSVWNDFQKVQSAKYDFAS